MTKSFSHILLILFFSSALLLPVSACFCQVIDTTYSVDTTTIEYDEEENEDYVPENEEDTATSAEIEPVLRAISLDTINAIKNSPDFYYMSYLDSLFRAEQKAKDNKPEEVYHDSGPSLWDLSFVKVLCWLVAIGLVGFVLFKLFLGGGIFFTNKKIDLPAVELEDMANESDLEKALNGAIKKKDYRMATRYLFLITLGRLGEKGILQLSTEKTNYQYASELSNKPYANSFAQLSLKYEYVWFGDFAIGEKQFTALQQQHQQFLKEI